MPVARRSAPRRRVFRTRAKYDYNVTTRRYKRLLPIMWPELEWELEVLEALENDVFAKLQSLGVPTDLWNFYAGFTKRVFERRMDFADATYQLEKQSLLTEYTLRGLDPNVLDDCQTIGESYAEKKKAGPPLAPPITAEYPGITALADENSMGQWPGVDTTEGVPRGPAYWPGMDVLADENSMGQWAGVTIQKEQPVRYAGVTVLSGNRLFSQWGGVTVVRGTV